MAYGCSKVQCLFVERLILTHHLVHPIEVVHHFNRIKLKPSSPILKLSSGPTGGLLLLGYTRAYFFGVSMEVIGSGAIASKLIDRNKLAHSSFRVTSFGF